MDEEERRFQVGLAVAGDGDALQRLIVEYHDAVRGVVARAMDPVIRRVLDPEDVLQDAYAAAFRHIGGGQFEGPGAFYKWLERIAVNELKDRERGLYRRKRDLGRQASGPRGQRTSYPALMERLAAPDSTPSRRVARNEAVAAVLSSLARLSDDQRLVVQLRFLEGLAVREIAERMGRSEDAVHALCRRGLIALREAMGSISRYLSGA